MSDKVLSSQPSRTPVPENFKEIHHDLWVVSNPKMFRGILGSACLIFVVPLFVMFLFHVFRNDWTSAAPFGAIVIVSILVGIAVRYATAVNQEQCWYASWIFKSFAPTLCDAKIFTDAIPDEESLHHFVITLDADPERQFDPYVIAKDGKHQSRFSGKTIASRSLKLNVWFDPKTNDAVVAEDSTGTRYWLKSKRRC